MTDSIDNQQASQASSPTGTTPEVSNLDDSIEVILRKVIDFDSKVAELYNPDKLGANLPQVLKEMGPSENST